MLDRNLRRLGITGSQAPQKLSALMSLSIDRKPNPKITIASVEEMISLREKGLGQQEIAQRLGITQSAVSKRLRQHGVRNNKFTARAPRKLAA